MLGPWAPQNLWLGKQTLLLGGMLYFILFYNNAWSEKHYVSPVKLKQYQFENKILTGVSGSSENRFNLSSLLAERIPSSVSEIYCYGRNGKKDGKRQSKDNFIQIINCLIRFLLFQWVLLSNGLDLKSSYMYVYVMCFFSKWIVCVLEAYQNITNASLPNIRKVNFLEYLETSTDYQSYSFLSSAKAFLCFLAVSCYHHQLFINQSVEPSAWMCISSWASLSVYMCNLMQNIGLQCNLQSKTPKGTFK